MELENLRTIWKNAQAFHPKDETEIASMLTTTSKSIVHKLKRNVWIDVGFTLITGIALLIYAMMLENGSVKWTSISLLALFIGYSFYYAKKLTLLNRFDPSQGNIKTNLEVLIGDLTGYLTFYKRSYAFLYPLYLFLALLFGLLERGTDEFVRVLNKPEVILYLIGVAIVFFLCSIWLTSWYLKKMYGNHLQRLKDLLSDLESSSFSVTDAK